MNLNKNQRKFFIEAVNHFGEGSTDVRLKDLNDFAKERDLIVPTSALKKHCQDEGQVRGHYNLQLTGIKPTVKEPEPMKTFGSKENVIVESSAFVEPPVPSSAKRKMVKAYVPDKGQKEKTFKRPIYVVSNGDGNVVGTHETPKGAFERRKQVFHDHGLMEYEDFITRMKYVGGAIIPSATTTSLHCLIEIMEIEP